MVESEEEIREIQNELRRKQKSFSDLAKEFSLGPEGAQGGDLGYFEAGQMPEEFDDVFKLKKNVVSSIIQTPYGFHLFKVVDKMTLEKIQKALKTLPTLNQVTLDQIRPSSGLSEWIALANSDVIQEGSDLVTEKHFLKELKIELARTLKGKMSFEKDT